MLKHRLTHFHGPDSRSSSNIQYTLGIRREGGQVELPVQGHFCQFVHDVEPIALFLMEWSMALVGNITPPLLMGYLVIGQDVACLYA